MSAEIHPTESLQASSYARLAGREGYSRGKGCPLAKAVPPGYAERLSVLFVGAVANSGWNMNQEKYKGRITQSLQRVRWRGGGFGFSSPSCVILAKRIGETGFYNTAFVCLVHGKLLKTSAVSYHVFVHNDSQLSVRGSGGSSCINSNYSHAKLSQSLIDDKLVLAANQPRTDLGLSHCLWMLELLRMPLTLGRKHQPINVLVDHWLTFFGLFYASRQSRGPHSVWLYALKGRIFFLSLWQ